MMVNQYSILFLSSQFAPHPPRMIY